MNQGNRHFEIFKLRRVQRGVGQSNSLFKQNLQQRLGSPWVGTRCVPQFIEVLKVAPVIEDQELVFVFTIAKKIFL